MKAAIASVGRRDDTIVASLEWSLCRLVRRDIRRHLGGSAGGPLSNAGLFDLYPKLLILLVPQEGFEPPTPSLRIKGTRFPLVSLECPLLPYLIGLE
jgi:hypothetical protein